MWGLWTFMNVYEKRLWYIPTDDCWRSSSPTLLDHQMSPWSLKCCQSWPDLFIPTCFPDVDLVERGRCSQRTYIFVWRATRFNHLVAEYISPCPVAYIISIKYRGSLFMICFIIPSSCRYLHKTNLLARGALPSIIASTTTMSYYYYCRGPSPPPHYHHNSNNNNNNNNNNTNNRNNNNNNNNKNNKITNITTITKITNITNITKITKMTNIQK